MMRRLLVLLAVVVAGLSLVATAPAASSPLHRGSSGQHVKDLQWLLGGHDPNVYRKTIHPFRSHPITGQFGKRTARAVLAARWLLGEPVVYTAKCPYRTGKQESVGSDLIQILKGQQKRPLCWIGRASQRIEIERVQKTAQAPGCARRVVAAAKRELAAGVHEIPWGSNTGPRVRYYQHHTVLGRQGYSGFPWCVAFAQTMDVEAGIGEIADGTAGVFYAYGWAQQHGWLSARPVVGAWVSFLRNSGHQGIVTGVTPRGFSTIEGNSGDAVRAHSYPLGYRLTVFIVPPCAR